MGRVPITRPKGLPLFGLLFSLNHALPHHTLASMASTLPPTKLMVFSLGLSPVVVISHPHVVREILDSPHFTDRPVPLNNPLRASCSTVPLGLPQTVGIGVCCGGLPPHISSPRREFSSTSPRLCCMLTTRIFIFSNILKYLNVTIHNL